MRIGQLVLKKLCGASVKMLFCEKGVKVFFLLKNNTKIFYDFKN